MKTIKFTFLNKEYWIGVVPQPKIEKNFCNYGGYCKNKVKGFDKFCPHHQQLFNFHF